MKNCDEIVKGLLERRDSYVADKNIKRKKAIRISASLGCVCIVVSIVLIVILGGGYDTAQQLVSGNPAKNELNTDATGEDEKDNNSENTSDITSDETEKSTSVTGANKKPHKPSKENGKTNSSSGGENEGVTEFYEGESEPYVDFTKPNSDKTNRNPNTGNGIGELDTEGTTNGEPKYIQKIVITRLPDKTTYYLGDKLDLRGLQVMGYFTNGEVEDISERVYLIHSDVVGAVSNHYSITIEYTDDSESINIACTHFEVVVVAPDISISESSLTLNEGESQKISALTKASGCKITWFSTDTSVVTVDDSGNVTAVGEGTASVYAEISYGSYKKNSSYCTVTVNESLIQTVAE